MDLTQGATYVGALGESLDPAIIGNPPGVDFVSFDLTLESVFPEEGFVDIFIVFFGVQTGDHRTGLGSLIPRESRRYRRFCSIGTHKIEMQFDMGIDPVNFIFATFR